MKRVSIIGLLLLCSCTKQATKEIQVPRNVKMRESMNLCFDMCKNTEGKMYHFTHTDAGELVDCTCDYSEGKKK